MKTFLFMLLAVSGATCLVLCIAEFVLRRPIAIPIPSVYWPLAKLGFSRNRKVRRVFRLTFSDIYRKRFWNPVMNSWLRQKGFDRQRHLSTANIHAACSALVLALVALSVQTAHECAALPPSFPGRIQAWHNCFAQTTVLGGFELIFNAPAIILARYLYLLTCRRGETYVRLNGSGRPNARLQARETLCNKLPPTGKYRL